MRHDFRGVLPFLVAAGAVAVACSSHSSGPTTVDAPDASVPAQPAPAQPQSAGLRTIQRAHTFDRHAEKHRGQIYEQMDAMGAIAAGLAPDNDEDNRQAPFSRGVTPFVIGGVDQLVNGPAEPFFQSETSIAVNAAGTILIAGYNDAQGFTTTPVSLSGVARSSDGGQTWAPVPVGPGGAGTLPSVTGGSVFGDPDVKYDPTRDGFFYSSIYVRPSDGLQGISVHASNSGATAGTAWAGPMEVAPTFIAGHAADKEFIDVNTRTGRVLLGWTDFNGATSTGISTTFSDDGATTWSAAAQPIVVPAANGFVQGSVPRFLPGATNATSTAYIVWRSSDATGIRNIGCSRSTDGGATWSAPASLDSVSYAPEDQILGVDRVATSPAMAVDYTGGQVYVVYQRNDSKGTGNVALRVFTGACAPGNPLILSSNPGAGRAQFMPWVTVDQSNRNVHVIWYDNGHDPTGDVVETMHTVSTNGGVTWSPPTPLVDRPFRAGFGNDTSQPNMGDYIQAIAQKGKLHTLWGGTSIAPLFSEGQPAVALISPDTYYDVRLDTDTIVPLRLSTTTFAETSCKALGNGYIDPGETISLNATIQNYVGNATVGATTITGVAGVLSTSTAGVTITAASASWADLAPLATGNNTLPFAFQVAPSFTAGTPIDFLLTLSSNQGTTQLPIRAETGTPGTPTPVLVEDFESVTPPGLPVGWTAAVGGGAADPWVTSNAFAPMTTKFAFHGEGSGAIEWMRLFSPVTAIPAAAGQAYVSLDFDVAYRLLDEPTQLIQAYDGLTLRITDQTAGSTVRSVLAEAFAQKLTTGNANHFPKHLIRSNSNAYLQDMSVWSGDSGGVKHVAMRFPANGMAGRSVQLRFEYTQLNIGNCTAVGYAAPCGVGVDNVDFQLVPLTDGHCATSDLAITKGAAPEPVQAGGTLTYTLNVSNLGPSPATNIKVADTLPAGVALVSATGIGWVCVPSGSTVNCSFPALAVGANSSITIVVTAPATAGSITNTANVSGDQFDPVLANNTASATTTVAKCGDGVVQKGEQCDDGAANGTMPDCCSAACQFQPSTQLCRAATDSCDVAGMCTGSSATCPVDSKLPNGTDCPGNTTCNAQWTCQTGVCTPGMPVNCDDSNPCTTDSCDMTTGCKHVNVVDGMACTDSDMCSMAKTCQMGMCKGTPVNCNDNNPCTTDTCDMATGCKHANATDGTACNDGNKCMTAEVCTTGMCKGMSVTCKAMDACHTVGTCDMANGNCSNPPAPGGAMCPGGSCDGNGNCVPTASDAGSDTGAADSGVDSGGGTDGGKPDSGLPAADASGDAAGDAGAVPGDTGGCGCRTAGSNQRGVGAVAAILGLPLLLAGRRRRRRGLAVAVARSA